MKTITLHDATDRFGRICLFFRGLLLGYANAETYYARMLWVVVEMCACKSVVRKKFPDVL